ncbi:hypothetical protein I314_03400 [Cryptococcus bacillisporus CA1873]|uniref:Uncharacterized protein n=1 Tax=Cryptococcus bacillisporus CA1873 TaxID=1296111 RepID=A0ABR5BAP7_CRYGA|nr:hypothetical protein I314_03400 [Cryptococcus bacillisporus CA1873]|eukprot:KIR62457.1 hypothetical protein I314_03400 [Cryptococcus gattii CA1873]
MPKNAKDKGKAKETGELVAAGSDVGQNDGIQFPQSISGDNLHPFLSSTNTAYDRPTLPSIPPAVRYPNGSAVNSPISSTPETIPRVLDVVRIPSSQLRFFPRPRPSESSSRTSTEQDRPSPRGGNTHRDDHDNDSLSNALRRTSLPLITDRSEGNGPSIVPNLSTLPEPFRSPSIPSGSFPLQAATGGKPSAHTRSSKSTTVVRLRPPQPPPIQTGKNNNTLANRLSSFFTIPPPPPLGNNNMSPISGGGGCSGPASSAGRLPQGGKARRSLESTGSHGTATPPPKSATSATKRGSGIIDSSATSMSMGKGKGKGKGGGREQREEMELVTRVREQGVGSGMGMGNGFGARKPVVKGKKSQKND